MTWFNVKEQFISFLHLPSDDMIHFHGGMALYWIIYLVFRKSSQPQLIALAVLCATQTINEAVDYVEWRGWTGGGNWPETVKDALNTLLWPTIITFVLAFCSRGAAKARSGGAPAA